MTDIYEELVPTPKPTPTEWLKESKKAVVGFVAAAICAFFLKNGIDLEDTEVQEVLGALLTGLITAVPVWWAKNRDKYLRGKDVAGE